MGNEELDLEQVHEVQVDAKGARNEGIGRLGNLVIFIKSAKTRIGNRYRVKLTKVYRTFAYAELDDGTRKFVGNGSLVDIA